MIDSKEFFTDKKVADLAEAVRDGNPKKIKSLVKEGVNPNSVGENDTSLLFWAIMVDSIKGFEALLNEGADPSLYDQDGRTMLHIAATAGNPGFLKLLLKKGIDPNIKSQKSNDTALYDVSGSNDANFSILLDAGINLDSVNNLGRSILHDRALSGSGTDQLIQLLKKGADPSIKDKKGETFQGYFFDRSEDMMTEEAKEKRRWVRSWLEQNNIPLQEN